MKNIKCRNCFFYRNEWCEKIGGSPDPEEARYCNYFREMTNADRIRAMSDEEIADWVSENGAIKTPCDIICGGDCKAFPTFEKTSIERCKEIVMKWLQQPAGEDKHENLD